MPVVRDSGLRRAWKLRRLGSEYLVVSRAEASRQALGKREPEFFSASQLRDWLESPHADVLWEMYEAVGGGRCWGPSMLQSAHERERLAERLADAFFTGELVALPVERMLQDPRVKPRTPTDLFSKPPEPAKELTYVALEMVDEDGNPASGLRYRITLPSGATREGTLSASGYARIDGVDPGSCKVSFPDLDASSWDKA
jgi:hypothetical protein